MDSSNYFLSHSSLSYHHQSPHHDCCNARPSEPDAALTSAPLLIFCPFGDIFMHTGMFTQCYYYFFFCTSLFMSYSASRNIWSRGERASDRNYPVSVPRLLLQASECEVTSRDLRWVKSWQNHLLAVWFGVNFFTSMCLGFLIYKRRITIEHNSQSYCKD